MVILRTDERNTLMKNKFSLRRLEYKLAPYAINNLMTIMIGAMAIVFIADFAVAATGRDVSLYSWLMFDKAAIASGQIWRLFTFIFLPPDTNLIWVIFALYFYYIMGQALEREWGALRFNIFYLCGIIGALISGLITGYATNSYLNLSLFLAFAIFYPNYQVLIFFILPIKIKWLAWLDAVMLTVSFIFSGFGGKLAILFSVLNVMIFFYRDFWYEVKRIWMNTKFRITRWKNSRK